MFLIHTCRCRNTGDVFTCPDGSYMNYTLAQTGIIPYMEGCKMDEFNEFPEYPKAVTKLL
jgi:hypothetical protein